MTYILSAVKHSVSQAGQEISWRKIPRNGSHGEPRPLCKWVTPKNSVLVAFRVKTMGICVKKAVSIVGTS